MFTNGASPCYQTLKVAIVSSSFTAYDTTLKNFDQQCCKSLITTFLTSASVTEVSSHCFPLTVWWITLWQVRQTLFWRDLVLWKWRNWLWRPCWSALCVLCSWMCQPRCCPVSTLSACHACRSMRQPTQSSSVRTVVLLSPPGRWRNYLQTSYWCGSWRGSRDHPGPAGTEREPDTLCPLPGVAWHWGRVSSSWRVSKMRSAYPTEFYLVILNWIGLIKIFFKLIVVDCIFLYNPIWSHRKPFVKFFKHNTHYG